MVKVKCFFKIDELFWSSNWTLKASGRVFQCRASDCVEASTMAEFEIPMGQCGMSLVLLNWSNEA
jgi:hypothetical protein